MRHPHLDFVLPSSFVALLDWLLKGAPPHRAAEHAERKTRHILYDLDEDLLASRAGVALGPATHGELAYDNWPLEVIPFAFNGGSGLMYAWALLAPELELAELPCVSFAPVDDGGALWLGDGTKDALEALLIGRVRGWERGDNSAPPPYERPEWAALCAALGLAPDLKRADVKAGARVSDRKIAPPVPAGYRFVLTPDGVGVLAPEQAFGADVDLEALDCEDATLTVAREHLAAGHPASALVALKEGAYDESPRALVEAMRRAHGALGRPALVKRADAWLAQHP